MKLAGSVLVAALLAAMPTRAGEPEFAKDLAGSLRGCEAWLLQPSNWTDGPTPFLDAIGRGERVAALSRLPEAALPPPGLRQGNRSWRIAADNRSGVILTVSDDVPMCHIVGGGAMELRDTVADLLDSAAFKARWEMSEESRAGGLVTGQYRYREDARFTMTVSRPDASRADPPGIQVLATAIYDPGS